MKQTAPAARMRDWDSVGVKAIAAGGLGLRCPTPGLP